MFVENIVTKCRAISSIFYGQWIPAEVFFFCQRKKNLLAGCRREIRVIFERFRRFFDTKPTDFVKKFPDFLECQRKKKKKNFFPVENNFASPIVYTAHGLMALKML